MKNKLITALMVCGFMTLCFSCQDFLEKPVSSEINVDSVFASKVRTEQFLWNVYNTCSIYEFPYYWHASDYRFQHYGSYGALVSAATDELQCEAQWPYIVRFRNVECLQRPDVRVQFGICLHRHPQRQYFPAERGPRPVFGYGAG